jgi:hypothetical protein
MPSTATLQLKMAPKLYRPMVTWEYACMDVCVHVYMCEYVSATLQLKLWRHVVIWDYVCIYEYWTFLHSSEVAEWTLSRTTFSQRKCLFLAAVACEGRVFPCTVRCTKRTELRVIPRVAWAGRESMHASICTYLYAYVYCHLIMHVCMCICTCMYVRVCVWESVYLTYTR